jgi:Tfp pilus assembly protein PilO
MQNSKVAQAAIRGNNLILVLALVSLLAVGAAVLVDKALIDNISRDTKVATAMSTARKTMDQNVKNAPQLVQAYAGLGQLNQVIKDALPNTTDFPGVLIVVENMAATAGIKLKTVSPVKAASASSGSTTSTATSSALAPKPASVKYAVTFDGSYATFAKFVSNLELSARPMHVSSVSLTGTGSNLAGMMEIDTSYQDKATLPITEDTIK